MSAPVQPERAARVTDGDAGGPSGIAPASADERRASIGWLRGIAAGLAVVVVGLAATVGVAQEILTNVSGLSRSSLAYLVSAVFLVIIGVAAWLLRRLQDRGII